MLLPSLGHPAAAGVQDGVWCAGVQERRDSSTGGAASLCTQRCVLGVLLGHSRVSQALSLPSGRHLTSASMPVQSTAFAPPKTTRANAALAVLPALWWSCYLDKAVPVLPDVTGCRTVLVACGQTVSLDSCAAAELGCTRCGHLRPGLM